MFRHGKAALVALAAGKGKDAAAAAFELQRRAKNKAARNAGGVGRKS
jgi:hypothetical protein